MRELRKDRLIYACIAIYGGIVATVAWYMGQFDKLSFLTLWPGLFENAVRAPALLLLGVCAVSVWKSPAAPSSEFRRRVSAFVSPRLVVGCVTIAGLTLFLGIFTTAKNLLPLFSSFLQNERQLADLDVLLHGQAVWRYLQPPLDFLGARRFVEFVYGPVWFLLVTGLPFVVIVFKRFEKVRQPFIVTWLLCWIVLGNLAAGYFLSAGPVFYGQVTGDFERFRELVEHVASSAGNSLSAYDIQTMLWSAHMANFSHLGTGISAFPSVHVSMATLIYLLARHEGPTLRISAAVFLVVILVGSVYLGWHYAIDGYFSIAATIIIWNTVSWAHHGRSYAKLSFRQHFPLSPRNSNGE